MWTEEDSKAAQEVVKTTRKGLESCDKFFSWFGSLIQGPAEQTFGIWEDKLKYIRWERQIRLMQRSQDFLNEMGLDKPAKALPLKLAIPLLQAASLEEDDNLQDTWARLLANAASGKDIHVAFISILKDFGPLEARLLDMIVNAPHKNIINDSVPVYGLPDRYEKFEDQLSHSEIPLDVQAAIWNLSRLGCLVSDDAWASSVIKHVIATTLGKMLVDACTIKAIK